MPYNHSDEIDPRYQGMGLGSGKFKTPPYKLVKLGGVSPIQTSEAKRD